MMHVPICIGVHPCTCIQKYKSNGYRNKDQRSKHLTLRF